MYLNLLGGDVKLLLAGLAVVSGVLVISTKNPIISVFNLIVLYILVAFYLIYIGITFIGISYIIVYIGAIAILFLFIIMMIDIEIVETKSSNYLPLLLFILGGFFYTLKSVLYNIGIMKINTVLYENKNDIFNNKEDVNLFNIENKNMEILENLNSVSREEYKIDLSFDITGYHSNLMESVTSSLYSNHNYLLILPNWDLALNKITQISAIGDVLYTVYHSYIYIVSVILLLGMVGAIILTAGNNHYTRVLYIENNKESGLSFININHFLYYFEVKEKKTSKFKIKFINNLYKTKLTGSIYPFFDITNNKKKHSEDILGNLTYYIISNIIIGLLLLVVNSSFSLSVKYLEKGGGFECGFTSFVQTRERFNVIFYRVSLLFLVFDLEIILAFPYTALYQKNQNISKNNILAFLYILVIGFIYELKEGALNIVKTAQSTDINMNNLITTQSEKIKLNNTNNTFNNNIQFDTLILKSRI